MQTRPADALRHDRGSLEPVRDVLALEAPLQVSVNGVAFTVTMRTPGDDRRLARGLLHAEGILAEDAAPEWASCVDERLRLVRSIDARVDPAHVLREFENDRALLSTTSCGLCGVRDAGQIGADLPPLTVDGEVLDPARIPAMLDTMRARQDAFERSGGCHAAAAFTLCGEMLALAEDVGRHNAVDKVVGALLEEGVLARARVLLVSGRLSYEIVFKAWRARLPWLLAVSAPSSMAVLMGERLGICVAGFCRGERATFYSHAARVLGGASTNLAKAPSPSPAPGA